jgi:hypothetical protein
MARLKPEEVELIIGGRSFSWPKIISACRKADALAVLDTIAMNCIPLTKKLSLIRRIICARAMK